MHRKKLPIYFLIGKHEKTLGKLFLVGFPFSHFTLILLTDNLKYEKFLMIEI
jgi:hypothetical protein